MMINGIPAPAKRLFVPMCLLVVSVTFLTAPTAADARARNRNLTASINIPLDGIQEGQYCVAYAMVYGGQPPYSYDWSGSYFSGNTQWVAAEMWGEDGYVYLEVIDASLAYDNDLVWLDVDAENDLNLDCAF